jgi:anthranilate phosphoribosyltransferase
MMEALLARLTNRQSVADAEWDAAFAAVFDSACSAEQIAAFLTLLRGQPLYSSQLISAARALRARMTLLEYPEDVLDSCGTGGDHQGTINLSTATAVVLAAAGIKVAKHGNRAVSSTSGSSDVMSLLGVQVNLSPEAVRACLDAVNLGFCFAQRFHPCLKRLAPIRQKLGVPTILNLLGPLANPARARLQLVGVGQPAYQQVFAEALVQLGTLRAAVVHGAPGLDEVSLAGPTEVLWIEHGTITPEKWLPEDFGLARAPIEELRCSSVNESAERLRRILSGAADAGTPWIWANAAAGFLVADRVKSLQEGVQLAQDVIRSGQSMRTLEHLCRLSQQETPA